MPDIIWTDAVLNAQADGTWTQPDAVGMHTGDPGATGTLLEATGGTPAYARIALTFTAAGAEGTLGPSFQAATVGVAYDEVTFDLPAGDYTYLSFWKASVFQGRVQLPTTVSHVSQGTTQVSLPLGAV